MADRIGELLSHVAQLRGGTTDDSLVQTLKLSLLEEEAGRLVKVLKELETGCLSTTEAEQALGLLKYFRSRYRPTRLELAVVEPTFRRLSSTIRESLVGRVVGMFDEGSIVYGGVIRIIVDAPLRIAESDHLLQISLPAAEHGLEVLVEEVKNLPSANLVIDLKLATLTEGHLWMSATKEDGSLDVVKWTIILSDDACPAPSSTLDFSQSRTAHRLLKTPTVAPTDRQNEPFGAIAPLSVGDLFGDRIALRDLEPRCTQIRGLRQIRDPLGFAHGFIPRKNEPEYARVLQSFIADLEPRGATGVVYIGDTLFNDGSAIWNLQKLSARPVWGFVCKEITAPRHTEFILGNLYFANRWSSLVTFLEYSLGTGLRLGSGTICFFDLDQTVYAAKGRDDEPLRLARWEAILAFLRDTVPSYKFDARRAEAVYRTFDRDEYHPITRDNMDYIVLLVLAVAAGLCDPNEIMSLAESQDRGVTGLIEEIHRRAAARKFHEDIDRVLEVIKAVYYNTLVGDQTPCKDFRKYECNFTLKRMKASEPQFEDPVKSGRICLNREVVDLICFLRDAGCTVMGVSDRPPEAALLEDDDGPRGDLLWTPMQLAGVSILTGLRAAASRISS